MSNRSSHLMHRVKRIHMIGVGGAGMSGIAAVLCNSGYEVSGSDVETSDSTKRLQKMGICIKSYHDASHVSGADVVVYSSAIKDDNVELMVAKSRRIPTVPRAEMLAELMRFQQGIAVAGTHGKTTTTSLIAAVMAEAGQDPTFIVGGLVKSVNAHAKLGTGRYLVAEADESDGSFLLLQPLIAVLTNVDEDHMATYGGDFSRLLDAYGRFLHRLPFYGVACICADDERAVSLIPDIRSRVVTYGFSEKADVCAYAVRQISGREYFKIKGIYGEFKDDFELNLPGYHNVQNAVGAITVALELGLDVQSTNAALSNFEGIDRRCQIYEKIRLNGREITVVDDYGHHPRELQVVFETIRRCYPNKRLIVVFQPHRYTRTRDLFDDFANVLSELDLLILLEVYPAGEVPISNADSRALSKGIRAIGRVEPIFLDDTCNLPLTLSRLVEDGDVVAMLGAGNIGRLTKELVS